MENFGFALLNDLYGRYPKLENMHLFKVFQIKSF